MGRISTPQGRGSQMHNRRDYAKFGKPLPDNIDPTKSHENVFLVDKDIKDAYREIFGEALAKYNAKQKRADRKIPDYYEHIKKSKNGEKLFYEDIIQWGTMKDFDNPDTRERAKEALVQYVQSFEARNPNIKLIGAYIHMDEASPHLHLDYIPVAHGYKQGMTLRNSMVKALKEMGFVPKNESRDNNAMMLWKKHERDYFAQICTSFGLEVEEEQKGRKNRLSVAEYKEARDMMVDELENDLVDNIAYLNGIQAEAASQELHLKDVTKQLAQAKVELSSATEEIDRKKAELKEVSDMVLFYQEDERYKLIQENKKLRAENNLFKEFLEKVVPQVVRDLWDDFCKKVKKREKQKDDLSR